ncbi:MAG: DUF1003 domain-containing protein [bacterium]|nr:DUF1003 domain-containing protein [bacterium]
MNSESNNQNQTNTILERPSPEKSKDGVSKISRKRYVVKSFEAKLNQQRTRGERMADYLTKLFGSISFFIFNLSWFLAWVIWNSGLISVFPIFDPYPFILLITIVSLEAICLAVLVLMSQNRAAKIDKLRSEVDLQINLTTEQEVTKILSLLKLYLEKHGFDLKDDPELERMLRQIDTWEIEKKLEKDLSEN